MKKELFVLVDYAGINPIDLLKLDKCDRLAMSPDSMLLFEERKLPYFTFDDFYDYRKFRVDNYGILSATEELFSILDGKYESFLKFPRAFTGSIYPFSIFFADLLYVFRVCSKIADVYDKIYFGGSAAYQDFSVNDSRLLSNDFNPFSFPMSLRAKVMTFRSFLISKNIYVANIRCNNSNTNHRLSRLDTGRYHAIYWQKVKRVSKKLVSYLRHFLLRNLSRKKGLIFVVQDYYEVGLLKDNMRDFLYLNPINNLFRMPKVAMAEANGLKSLLNESEEIKNFAKRWFPGYHQYISELFIRYHDTVLSCFGSFLENCKGLFDLYKPSALLYSIGATTIYDNLCAYLANQLGIPVFYFDHNATSVYVEYPYVKYLEEGVDKISIIHSKREKELSPEHASGNIQALGSIKLYNLYSEHKKETFQKSEPVRILYCPSPFSLCGGYASLTVNISDSGLFGINKEVVGVCDKLGLNMDIKVHPCAEEYNYQYFKNLLRIANNNSIRVLAGFAVEEIIKDYSLLILDHAGTALISVAIALDLPVILYLKDRSRVRKEVMPDIVARFYLAENREDLEKYLSLHISGKLNSKFSRSIVDKYAFPVDNGDPNVRISDYIRKYLEKAKVV